MPGDYGTRYTDQQRRETTERLREIYSQAERDLSAKLGEFQRGHQARDEKYRAMVEAGTLTKEDYEAWLRGQAFQSRQFEDAIAQVVNTMANVDKLALDIIDGKKRDIFCTNANFIGYDLEQNTHMNLAFGIYDASTVERLIRDNPDLLRPLSRRKINEGKEIPYYQDTVTNCITQGIIQGESIDQICSRIVHTCPQRGETAALRDARTAYTGAQNAGRIEGMHQAEELGIDIRKKWMCTLDEKTRETHQELDGQTQKPDDPFVVDGDEIMYPGDPRAKAALVYNCRCTLVSEYPKYSRGVMRTRDGVQVLVQTQHGIPRRDNMTGEDIGPMTYREWMEWKQSIAAQNAVSTQPTGTATSPVAPLIQSNLGQSVGANHANIMSGMVGKADQSVQDVWNQYSSEIKVDDSHCNGRSFYNPSTQGITFNIGQSSQGDRFYSPYSLVFHETGHNIDALASIRLNGGNGSTFFSHEYKNGLFAQTLEQETKRHITDYFRSNFDKFYPSLDARTIRFTGPTNRDIIQLARDYENGRVNIDQVLANDRVREGLFGLARKDVERSFCDYVKGQLSERELGDLSDMFEATITSVDYPFGLGHRGTDPTYWYDPKNRATEAFAEMFSAEIGNHSSLQTIQTWLPESYKVFKEIMGAMA